MDPVASFSPLTVNVAAWQELCPTDGELVSRIRDWIKDEFGSPVSVSDPAEAGLQGKLPMGHCRFMSFLTLTLSSQNLRCSDESRSRT